MAKLAPSDLEAGKIPESFSGSHYVADNCVCELCRQTAPLFFSPKHIGGPDMQRQRLTLHEQRLWRETFESLDSWPAEAIGYKLA